LDRTNLVGRCSSLIRVNIYDIITPHVNYYSIPFFVVRTKLLTWLQCIFFVRDKKKQMEGVLYIMIILYD
jgi:hypothetical protein